MFLKDKREQGVVGLVLASTFSIPAYCKNQSWDLSLHVAEIVERAQAILSDHKSWVLDVAHICICSVRRGSTFHMV